MSGLSTAVQDDSALFTEGAADTIQAELQAESTTPVSEPVETELGDVAQTLELQDSGIGDEIDALDIPESEQPLTNEPTPELPQPVDEAGMTAFSEQFKKYVGVDLKEAMTSYQEMTQAAKQAQTELSNLHQQVALQRQTLDLQVAWVSDPEIQQQVNSGIPLSAAVEQRLEQLRTVYSSLDEPRQKRIDALGSKGVLQLWQIVNKKTNRSLPGVGSVPSAGTNSSDLMTLSQIQNMPEAEFQKVGMKLLRDKQFINDMDL